MDLTIHIDNTTQHDLFGLFPGAPGGRALRDTCGHEHLLTIAAKGGQTTRERFDALCDRLAELHPYEVPELIAFEIARGLPAYLEWLARETAAP